MGLVDGITKEMTPEERTERIRKNTEKARKAGFDLKEGERVLGFFPSGKPLVSRPFKGKDDECYRDGAWVLRGLPNIWGSKKA